MRERRTYGSVRGVPGDRHPYRNSSGFIAMHDDLYIALRVEDMPAGHEFGAQLSVVVYFAIVADPHRAALDRQRLAGGG